MLKTGAMINLKFMRRILRTASVRIGSCLEVTGLCWNWLENTRIGTTLLSILLKAGVKVRSEAFITITPFIFTDYRIHTEFCHVYPRQQNRARNRSRLR